MLPSVVYQMLVLVSRLVPVLVSVTVCVPEKALLAGEIVGAAEVVVPVPALEYVLPLQLF